VHESADIGDRVRAGCNGGRPPWAEPQLRGKVVYLLRRHWRDGTSGIAFEPPDFSAGLATLVPRPRAHLLTYHGVLAQAAKGRDCSVQGTGRSTSGRSTKQATGAVPSSEPHEAAEPKTRKTRSTWAELVKHTFAIHVLIGDPIGGPRRRIALLTDGLVVRKILTHLALETEPPPFARARARPMPARRFVRNCPHS
jgi:hypothetical protein